MNACISVQSSLLQLYMLNRTGILLSLIFKGLKLPFIAAILGADFRTVMCLWASVPFAIL